jgi:asparagine synthase (glutamine-hydrolysing)
MTSALTHRGPDDQGIFLRVERGVGLGHRRLAVVDRSPEGHQPMVSRSGRYVLAYNGEAYNVAGLRRELARTEEGMPELRGRSDTELLLEAIDRFGLEGALARVVGMFAFALWDEEEGRLHLVRDRLGKKPLYFAHTATGWVFGSELSALRAWPELDREVSREALAAYLRFGHVPAPHAIYRGVRKVMPGALVTLSGPAADASATHTYWDAAERCLRGRSQPLPGTDEDVADAVEAVLRRAVAERMVADVPLGAFLSGGIDSSLVVALMQAQSGVPVRTFSIGYDERDYDEGAHAEDVARHLGTEHHALRVTAGDALEVVPALPRIYDEPFADSSQIPTYLVSRFARGEVTVALSGDGGDEVFGGYNRHLWIPRLLRASSATPSLLRRAASRGLRSLPPETWDRLFSLGDRVAPPVRLPGDKVHKLADVIGFDSAAPIYRRLRSQWHDPAEILLGARGEAGVGRAAPASLPPLERLMLDDLLTYLPDDILTKVDRASMAVSLEVRAPLLDHRLVELSFRLPPEQKIRGGETKRVLRRVLDRYVPRALVERPKMGFGVPVGEWLRGPLRDWAEALLAPERLAAEGYFDPAPLRARFEDHLARKVDATGGLWCVLMFQAWLEAERSARAPRPIAERSAPRR